MTDRIRVFRSYDLYYVSDKKIAGASLSRHAFKRLRKSVCETGIAEHGTVKAWQTYRVSTTTLGQFQSGVKTILFRLAHGT